MCLILERKQDTKADAVFQELSRGYAGRINFVKMDWSEEKGTDAAKEFWVSSPPASVLLDAHGHVMEKIQGDISAADLRAKLDKLIGR